MEKIVIIGGGSFICNLINYIESMGCFQIIGYTDIENRGNFWDVPYLGTDFILKDLYAQGVKQAAIAIGNRLNDTTIKQKAVNNAKVIGFKFPVIKGTNVIIHKGVEIGEGCILRDGAIIQSNCKIGDFVMIGDHAIITHDTNIGNFSQVVSGCILGRNLHIGKSVFFGYGAVVTNDLTISDGCVIGAQSLVNKDCVQKGLYFGQPSKLVKVYE